MGAVILMEGRSKLVDIVFPWAITSFSLLTPMTDSLSNFGAPWEPFRYEIWILLSLSLIAIPFFLYGIEFILNRKGYANRRYFARISIAFEYVISVLLCQGKVVECSLFVLNNRIMLKQAESVILSGWRSVS